MGHIINLPFQYKTNWVSIMDQARHDRSGKPILKSFKKSFIILLNLLVKRTREKISLSVSLKS